MCLAGKASRAESKGHWLADGKAFEAFTVASLRKGGFVAVSTGKTIALPTRAGAMYMDLAAGVILMRRDAAQFKASNA